MFAVFLALTMVSLALTEIRRDLGTIIAALLLVG